jgi:flagellar hook-basal body complex protein FliE
VTRGRVPIFLFRGGENMDLASINSQIAGAVANAKGVLGATSPAADTGSAGGDFASSLTSALKSVSQSQAQAEELQRQFQMENPNVSLEQTMVAMNTSALSFSAAVQVRNRLVQAYDSIMNMQV